MQSQTGQDTQHNTKFILLYLFKYLDSKKLYFRVEVRCQIHTCIPVPKIATYKKQMHWNIQYVHNEQKGAWSLWSCKPHDNIIRDHIKRRPLYY